MYTRRADQLPLSVSLRRFVNLAGFLDTSVCPLTSKRLKFEKNWTWHIASLIKLVGWDIDTRHFSWQWIHIIFKIIPIFKRKHHDKLWLFWWHFFNKTLETIWISCVDKAFAFQWKQMAFKQTNDLTSVIIWTLLDRGSMVERQFADFKHGRPNTDDFKCSVPTANCSNIRKKKETAGILITLEGGLFTVHDYLPMGHFYLKRLSLAENKNMLKPFRQNKKDFSCAVWQWMKHRLQSLHPRQSVISSQPIGRDKTVENDERWCRKISLSVFWKRRGIIFMDYLEKKLTINSEYYIALLAQVSGEIAKKRKWPWFWAIFYR